MDTSSIEPGRANTTDLTRHTGKLVNQALVHGSLIIYDRHGYPLVEIRSMRPAVSPQPVSGSPPVDAEAPGAAIRQVLGEPEPTVIAGEVISSA